MVDVSRIERHYGQIKQVVGVTGRGSQKVGGGWWVSVGYGRKLLFQFLVGLGQFWIVVIFRRTAGDREGRSSQTESVKNFFVTTIGGGEEESVVCCVDFFQNNNALWCLPSELGLGNCFGTSAKGCYHVTSDEKKKK
jgi:hypothetical protein